MLWASSHQLKTQIEQKAYVKGISSCLTARAGTSVILLPFNSNWNIDSLWVLNLPISDWKLKCRVPRFSGLWTETASSVLSQLWTACQLSWAPSSCLITLQHMGLVRIMCAKFLKLIIIFIFWLILLQHSCFTICVSFCRTAKWISHMFTFIPFLGFPSRLDHHRAPRRGPCAAR